MFLPPQDASIDLRKDLVKLAEIKKSLQGCLNCLPFQRSQVIIVISRLLSIMVPSEK